MEGKSWYLSRTVWGVVIGLAGLVSPKVVGWLGVTPESAVDTVVVIASAVADIVGVVLVIIGRVKAQGPLTK